MDISDIHILDYVEKNPLVNYLAINALNNRIVMVLDSLNPTTSVLDKTYLFLERDTAGTTRTVSFTFTITAGFVNTPAITLFNGSYYVLVPPQRMIWRINASTFALDTIAFTAFNPQGLVANNNAVVVFGSLGNGTAGDARIAASSNGTSFNVITTSTTELSFSAGLWDGTQFLILGQNSSLFLGNDTATTFTLQTTTGLSGTVLANSFAYSGVAYLIYAGGTLYRSTNFLSWASVSLSNNVSFQALTWSVSSNQFLLVFASNIQLSDSGGSTWVSTDLSNSLSATGAATLGTDYFLIGASAFLTGASLTSLTALSTTFFVKTNVQWLIDKYVLFIARLNSVQVTFSNDFYVWTDALLTNLPIASSSTWLMMATDGNNKIVRAITSSNLYYATGINNWTDWILLTISAGVTINSIIFGNNLFVAVGNAGAIWTSPTGANGSWTVRTSGTSNQLNFVHWTGSVFIAVGNAGTILSSPDGINWVSRTSGVTQNLLGCAHSGTSIMICGASGRLLRSTDGGVTFNSATSGTNTLGLIIFSNNTYYMNRSSKIATSTLYSSDDGVSFTVFTLDPQAPTVQNPFFSRYSSNAYSANANNWLVIGSLGTNTGALLL